MAANTGAGPDIILSTNDDANLYPDKLLDVTDVAEYIGKKYGPWYAAGGLSSSRTAKVDRRAARRRRRSMMVYRDSMVGRQAASTRLPEGHRQLLKMMKALHAKGHAGRHGALRECATSDGLCNWLIWTFGGKLVDKDNKGHDRQHRETLRALEYGRKSCTPRSSRHLVVARPNNNKAFLDGQISVTNNGISIYVAAKIRRIRRSRRWPPTSSTRRS